MARPPLIAHISVWSQLVPVALMVFNRGWTSRARVWVALGLLASVAGDTVQLLLGQRSINNLWVGYISTAVMGVLVVMALSEWQVTVKARQMVFRTLFLYIAGWGIALSFDDPTRFSALAFPMHSILALLLSLWTLIVNALEPRRTPLARQDWFWCCLGLALLYGGTSATQPLLRVLMEQRHVAAMTSVLTFKAGLQVVAMLLIAVGMLCPAPAPSGSSLLPAH